MNYPSGIGKNNFVTNIVYKNRGMNLENDINATNNYYIEKKKAFIYKKPTPIKLVKVDYKKGRIEEAYFDKPSTTDYNGIYQGKYIDFEAKETVNTEYFPLRNIHAHQIEHLRNISHECGISFLIVRFTKLNKTYLLFTEDLIAYIDHNDKCTIPITYFEKKGYLIKDKFIPSVDYLEIIDRRNNDEESKKRKK